MVRFALPIRTALFRLLPVASLLTLVASLPGREPSAGAHSTPSAPPGVEVVALRGHSSAFPENTLLAVREAVNQKAHWVQVDVQLTRDGRLVALTPTHLMVGTRNTAVRTLTYEQLASIDISADFRQKHRKQYPNAKDSSYRTAPRLRQVLKLIEGDERARVLIQPIEVPAERILEELEAHGLDQRFGVFSLNLDVLRAFVEIAPQAPRFWRRDRSERALEQIRIARDVSVTAFIFRGGLSKDLVEQFHASGHAVGSWDGDDARSTFRALRSWDCDYVFTRDPKLARQVFVTDR